MSLNFPNSPTNGDTYVSNNTTWQYDGTAWNIVGFDSNVNISNLSIDALTDVDTTTIPPSNGQSLVWNAGSSNWLPGTVESGGGGGEVNQNAFSTINVNGGTIIAADNPTDTFSLAGGDNITLSVVENTITITASATAGSSTFNSLSDAVSSEITIDKLYEPAIVLLRVDNVGTSAYTFSPHYSGSNPNLHAISGTTIAFDLDAVPGLPFEIQDSTGNPYDIGLVHVTNAGVVTTGSSAQGKSSGTLYWRIPESISGNYRYQCQTQTSMVGPITLRRLSLL